MNKIDFLNQKRRTNLKECGVEFTPITEGLNNSLFEHNQYSPDRSSIGLDASCSLVTQDEYNALKLENNLDHLNKDINQVNDELEQLKKLLFAQDESEYDI